MLADRWLRALIILLVLIAALHLGGVLWGLMRGFSDIIVIFFLAWLLSFVLRPVTLLVERSVGASRLVAAAGVYLVLLVLLVGVGVLIVPQLVAQLAVIGNALPAYAEQIPAALIGFEADMRARNIHLDITSRDRAQELSAYLAGLTTGLVQNAVSILTGVFNVAFAVVVALVLSFYMVIDGEAIGERFLRFVPDGKRAEVDFIFAAVTRTFGGFLRGTLVQALVYGLGTALVMLIAGLELVLVSSLFAGIIMIIPIFGPFLAVIPPVVIALSTAPVQTVLFVVFGLLILQQVTFNVIAPKVLSEAVGIHPLLVFAAILVGARVAGLTGAIFGVPVVAVLWALGREAVYRTKVGRLAQERYLDSERLRIAAEHARAEAVDSGASFRARLARVLGRTRIA